MKEKKNIEQETNEESIEVLDFEADTPDNIEKTEESNNTNSEETMNNKEENITNEKIQNSKPKEEKVIKKEIIKEKVVNKNVEQKIDNPKQDKKNNSKKNSKEIKNNNDNTNNVTKEIVVKKKSVIPTLVMIFVFLLLIGSIFALPYINDYFESKKNQNNNTTNNTVSPTQTDDENNNIDDESFKSNIDIDAILNDIKDIKSYKYENLINVYVKDEKNETFTIKNNLIYSFNETKYKIETSKTIADFSYNTVDYYEKIDDKYYIYQNDITTNSYIKDELTQDKFNTIYNLFNNTINYLSDNYEITNEKKNNNSTDENINITLKTNIDLLKNLSYETSRISNNIDISKLSTKDVMVDLYFNNDKELTKIEFSIEDKNIYQDTIDGKVESAVSKYTFSNFNNIKDITLPNL